VVSGERYSPVTVDHFQHPRNVGRLADADGVGRVDDPAHETMVSLYVRVEAGQVTRATFRTFGCSACIAASSMATELLLGCSVAEPAFGPDQLEAALGGLPEDKHYCAELVVEAARQALAAAAA
jgi:nitrogen fixation NifU-like protein